MMKKRVTERVLVLILSIAVLLSSTGVYSVFAETYSDTTVSSTSTSESSSSSTSAASQKETQGTTAAADEKTAEKETAEPNVISEGGAVAEEKISGEGTTDNPYKIMSADDLFKMQDIINDSNIRNKYFILANDIDLSSVSYAQMKANKVLPGTIVSVDKAKSDSAPESVTFTLNGNNHKIYGLNVDNTGSYAAAIFGYISAKSTIKYIKFENIKVTASYQNAVAAGAVALYNNGEIRDCTLNNVSVNVAASDDAGAGAKTVSKSLKITQSTGIIAVNAGSVKRLVIKKASVSVNADKVNIGAVVGINTGTVSSVISSGAVIKAASGNIIGAVAGKNSGRIESVTAENFAATVSSKAVFGGIAGENSGTVVSCVASGRATGSVNAGGIVGKATTTDASGKTSNVKNCYTFVKLGASSETGAVIASGESRYGDNVWSSETSGRVRAYADGKTDGDLVRETRLVTVKAGSTLTLSKASLGGKSGDVSYALDSASDIKCEGAGLSFSETEGSIVIAANEADTIGKITYTARVAVPAGYEGASSVSQKFTVAVFSVPEGTEGNGLTEETALEISNSAELRMISAAPFAHFVLAKDVKMPSDWNSSFSLTGSLNGNGHKITAGGIFCYAVYGKVENVNFVLCDEINTAMFGKAVNANFIKVRLTKGTPNEENAFVGLSAKKSNTAAFLNRVEGKTTLNECFTNIPVKITSSDIKNIAGFIGVLNSKEAVIASCGAVASITADDDKSVSSCSAFIGSASENAKGEIKDCYATLYSDLTSNVLIGGGNNKVAVKDSYYGSSNQKATAAPKKFTDVKASKWMFEEGEQGFVTGKGGSVSIKVPSNIIKSSDIAADDFKVMFNSEALSVKLKDASIENGKLTVPVAIAGKSATVKNSALVLIHKETGLRAEISISNGLEKDSDGNYIITSGSDFLFVSDNFEQFKNAGFVLSGDIDMTDVDFAAVGGAAGAFTGKLDGKGYTIKGLKVDGEAKGGLFGSLDGAQIKNIVFKSADINVNGSYAGVLAAQIIGGTKVTNIIIKDSKVSCTENVAGILAGEIKDSVISSVEISSSEVSALNNTGVLAGAVSESEISSVKAEDVKASGENNVGLIGEADNSQIKSVSISGEEITSKRFAGGVAGNAENSVLEGLKLSGLKVSSAAETLGAAPFAGGIAGSFSGKINKAEIEKSEIYADGNAATAGGVIAVSENVQITSVKVQNDVKVKASVAGGIIGEACEATKVKDSKACAQVIGSDKASKIVEGAGGIIGRVAADDFASVSIENTNAAGSVTAAEYVGGIIGAVLSEKATGAAVNNCVSAAKLDVTNEEGIEKSGHVIGFAPSFKADNIAESVSNVVFSSYASELNAYGNIDAPSTYCDLDKEVKSSLTKTITNGDEITVAVSNDKAAKLGFEFDKKTGWKSESEKRVAVTDSSENSVKIKASKSGSVGIVGTYVLTDDESIALNVHFDAAAKINAVLKGEGTAESPYIINNAFDLEAISDYADKNAFFALAKDISFKAEDFEFGGDFYNEGKGFTPVGTKDKPFNGTFDGNGHTVSGLTVAGAELAGLFGYVSDAEISSVAFDKANITGSDFAAVIAAGAENSKIYDVTVDNSEVTAVETSGNAAAIAAYAENTSVSDAEISAVAVKACTAETEYNTAYAGAVCARAVDVDINDVKVDGKCSVVSDGSAGGFTGYCENVKVSDSETFAAVSGLNASAVAANVREQLEITDVIAGGNIEGSELAAGLAAEAYAPVKANNVVVSAKISSDNTAAVVAAFADEKVFTDSAKSDVELNNIIYSSFNNVSEPFASAKINAYQSADYINGVEDINNVKPADGEFVVIGKDKAEISKLIKSEYDMSGFEIENVYTEPENLVSYDKSNGTICAEATETEGAELIIRYNNGLEVAVPLVSIEGMTGNGTNASPYIIDSKDTLKLINIYPDAVFLMKNDVVLDEEWTPVENFSGVLDGAGYTISGLNVKADNAGLFAALSGSAVVKNITFADAVIEGKSSAGVVAANVADSARISKINVVSSSIKAEDYAAAVAGSVNSAAAVIDSCSVTGCTVEANNAAGIAAAVSGKAVIASDSVAATEIKGSDAAGGIIALAQADELTVKSCESSADVSADDAGAIIGIAEKNTAVDSCSADGNVSGKNTEGGIIGLADGNVSVKNSRAFASLSGKAKNTAALVAKFVTRPEDSEDFAKNFSGNVISGEYDEFEPAVMKYQNYAPAVKEEKAPDLEGKGTKENPYRISSASDLAKIPDSTTAYYVLNADIKITEKDYGISINKDGETVYGVFSDGYRPIKNFAGVFDGNGHVIKGLYIDSDSDYVGLFANITANGSVKNLHVELLEKSAGLGYYGIKGNDYVGGIAGYCDSVNGIENCSVYGSSVSGRSAVGGLVGGLASSEIKSSFAVSEINAQNKAGGLAGVTTGKSTISGSFAACEVNAAGGTIAGTNNGELTLKNVMVNGGSHGTGAVVVAVNNGTIKAEKVLIAGGNADGKTAVLNADEAEYVYCDKTSLGISDANITGLTTAQLTSSKPEGLEDWNQDEGKYPVPKMADAYSDRMAASAASASDKDSTEDIAGNVKISYKLVNNSGSKAMNSKLTGVLIKSHVNGNTVTEDFFTSCSSTAKTVNKLLVKSGGFYVDSSLPRGYGFVVTAADSRGRAVKVTDAGAEGVYVECGIETEINLTISIVKTDIPWGIYSLWESLAR